MNIRPPSRCAETGGTTYTNLSTSRQEAGAPEKQDSSQSLNLAEDEGTESRRALPTEGVHDSGGAQDDSSFGTAGGKDGQQQEQWVPRGLKTVNSLRYAEVLTRKIFALDGADELVEQKLACAM